MTDPRPSLDSAYFEAIYTKSADPWGFRTSSYERDKYAATLAILSRDRYERGLEVGCSIGVFTRLIAQRCAHLLALDISTTAIAQARRENADLGHVAFREATLPRDVPDGTFDLIVLSEMLYFLSRRDLAALADYCVEVLAPGGEIVLCHWLGATDYPLGGDEASDLFMGATAPLLRRSALRREAHYRLDLLTAPR